MTKIFKTVVISIGITALLCGFAASRLDKKDKIIKLNIPEPITVSIQKEIFKKEPKQEITEPVKQNETKNEVQNETKIDKEPATNSIIYAQEKNISPQEDMLYVEGFGYVKKGEPGRKRIVHSTGDINKIVGTMN